MDQVHVIRHKVLIEGQSQRKVAREMGISRLTVRKYVGQAVPERRESDPRPRPVWQKVAKRIDTLLAESPTWTDKKQRLTATRLHDMLRNEGHQVGVTLVKEAVAEWRRQRREVFIPLVYRPGDLAEVDFFEVLVDEAGHRRKAWLFLLRLMYSGRDFAWLYHRQDQIAFLDGHVRAFAHLGGVPARIAYDNLKPAVVRILVGAERQLTTRFAALASHYLFEPCFCRPATGHDKGGVEARGKTVRWQHLVPIPAGPWLDSINRELLQRLDGRLSMRRAETAETIGQRWAVEAPALRPTAVPFDAARTEIVTVSPRSLVRLDGGYYSVPEPWARLDITARVGAEAVEFVGPDGRRIPHARLRFGGRSVDYRHYLRSLSTKPQAVRQVLPDLLKDLGDPFPATWQQLETVHGPREAARVFARILGELERRGAGVVVPALVTALATGTPLLLAVAAADAQTAALPSADLPGALARVVVPSGCAADYDAWLTGVAV
jgi:transposase